MKILKNEALLEALSNDTYYPEPIKERRGSTLLALAQCALLCLLFIYSGPLIRLLDPSAGVLDAGILSIFLLDLFVVDAFVVAAWLLLRLIYSTLTGGRASDLKTDLFTKNEIPCLETKKLLTFWGFVLLFVGLFVVLL